jgi:hypothetical protein
MTNSSNNDSIGQALNLAPVTQTEDAVRDLVAIAHDDSAINDFNMARSNIHEVIQNNSHAIDKLSQIADQSQHPRAFEVLATLMKVQLDANKDLLDLQKKIREIQLADEPHNDEAKNITNNLFVGSTTELQKMIENMKNGNTTATN